MEQVANEDAANTMTGGRVVVEVLRSLGATDFFTLPGAQTLPLYDELRKARDFNLHFAVDDTCAVGMADGFARATGRLAVANVYEFAGFANSVCHVYSALMDRIPLLVIGSLTDARQLGRGWSAEIANISGYASHVTKLSIEVTRADKIEEALRRAIQVATCNPKGPVYVGMPANLWMEPAPTPGRIVPLRGEASVLSPDEPSIRRVAEMILGEDNPCLVGGADVANSAAVADLESLSLEYALPVYVEPYAARMPVGSNHPLFFRVLTPSAPSYRSMNLVVAVGAKLAKRFSYYPFEYLLPHQKLCHIHVDPNELCRTYPTEVAVLADALSGLRALRAALESAASPQDRVRIEARRNRLTAVQVSFDEARKHRAEARMHQVPADPAAVLNQIGAALRPQDIVVDELLGLRHWWPVFMDLPLSDRYFGTSAGFMGWGPAAATGIALALSRSSPGGKAVLLLGDGCFLMAPQALWSAAHEKAPVVFIVMNNAGYNCLKGYYDVVRTATGTPQNDPRIGCDFDSPAISYVDLAKGFGVPGRQVHSGAQMRAALDEALSTPGPVLLDVVLKPHDEELYDYPKP